MIIKTIRYMKRVDNIRLVTLFVALCMTLGLLSCEKEPQIAELPNLKEIHCNAGDRPSFTFSVGANWQLSSDAIWCKFITSGGELLDMAGSAGTHTITLRITNDDIKTEATYANITIKAGGKQAIIARVERGPSVLYIKVYDITDTPKSAIELGYIDWIPFRIEANFRFAATDYPEWMEFEGGSLTGIPGERTESMARIVPDGIREQYPITAEDGYTVTFSDESGTRTFEIPIVFNGMGNDDLTFVGPTEDTFGWEVSLDGTTFQQYNEASSTTLKFNNELQYAITAYNNDYEIVCFEKVVDRGIPSYKEGANWISFDKSDMTLTVGATDKMRHGLVMALPRGIHNKVRGDIMGHLFEMDSTSGIELETIVYDYLQFVLIEFTQKDLEVTDPYYGMYVYHSLTTYEIPCAPYTDSAIMEQYGVTDAFSCPFANSVPDKKPGIIINPLIEAWTTLNQESGIATVEVWHAGQQLKISDGEYYVGENKDEELAIHLWGPKDGFTEDVHIIFKVDGVAKKLLVVTPPVM